MRFFVYKDRYYQVKDANFMEVCLRFWVHIRLGIR